MGNDKTEQRSAYLGPEASFSHQAAIEALPTSQPVPIPSFRAILEAIQNNTYDFAVLPVENSTNGSVVQSLDLLALCGLDPATSLYPEVEVIDEHYLEVHHCLFISRQLAQNKLSPEELTTLPCEAGSSTMQHIIRKLNLKTLYTHPQVWGQCNNILSTLLPPGHVERVDMSSTSAAAAFVANLKSEESAAISSSLAGEKHRTDLVCIAKNIEDEPGANTTRFLVLRHRQSANIELINGTTEEMKSLWSFTVMDEAPGELAMTLAVFARFGFNLCAIQSRPEPKAKQTSSESKPSRKRNWRYVFFVECLYSAPNQESSAIIQSLLDELRHTTVHVSLLGCWKARHPSR